jgi:hypothetical protein
MESEGRIAADAFPKDWRYYTLTLPVGYYKHLSQDEIYREMDSCNRQFYSMRRILRRAVGKALVGRKPFLTLVANMSNRNSVRMNYKAYREFVASQASRHLEPHQREAHDAGEESHAPLHVATMERVHASRVERIKPM